MLIVINIDVIANFGWNKKRNRKSRYDNREYQRSLLSV